MMGVGVEAIGCEAARLKADANVAESCRSFRQNGVLSVESQPPDAEGGSVAELRTQFVAKVCCAHAIALPRIAIALHYVALRSA
jgi:hypothetical protein